MIIYVFVIIQKIFAKFRAFESRLKFVDNVKGCVD